MKFSCEKHLLLTAVLTASRAAAAKSPVPALEGLLIDAGSDAVRISGYDMKIGIVTTINADIEETGSIVLNSRLLCEIVRKLPGDFVTLSLGTNSVATISCEMSEFEILGSASSDYPELPIIDNQSAISINEVLLKKMIAQTNFAVSDNESRPIHTGALFDIKDGDLTVVAVDGFRLALRRERLSGEIIPSCNFVVPGTALSEVEKIAGDEERNAVITLGTKHIMFTLGDTLLISRRLEGEFLNYKNSIPQSCKYSVTAVRREFIDAIERVSLIINDKLKSPVRCVFTDSSIKLYTKSALGKASDECGVDGGADDLEIGFNNKYLLDALRAAPDDNIKIELTSGVTPCVLSPADGGDSFLYMVLPVRL